MEQWLRHSQQFWTVTLRRHENFYFQTLEKLFGRRSETSNSVSLSGLLQSWSITETLHLLWPVCTRLCPPPDINLQHLPKMHFVKFTQVTQKQIKQRCLFLLPCPVYCTNQSADFQRAQRRDADAKRSTDWRQTDASMFQRKGRHFCLFQLPNSSSQTFYSFGFLVTGVTKSTNLKHPRFKRLSGSSGHASVLSVTVGRVL